MKEKTQSQQTQVLLSQISSYHSLLSTNGRPGIADSQSNKLNAVPVISSYGLTTAIPVFILPSEKPSYDSRLDEPWTWSKEKQEVEKLRTRIKYCKDSGWGIMACRSCGNIVGGKPVRFSCMSNYCLNEDCIRNRKLVAMEKLRSLGIKSKKLYHFVIGFYPVSRLTKEHLKHCNKIFREVMKEIEKTHPKLKAVAVRDINRAKEGLRVHYHVGALPVKDFRLLATSIRRATKVISHRRNTSVSPSLAGYSDREAMFKYFAGRMAGQFGHPPKSPLFHYSDVMSLEEYHKVVYHIKTWFRIGLKLRAEGSEFIETLTNSPKICPFCGDNRFHIVRLEAKPPPGKLLYCHCGAWVTKEGWNDEFHMCWNCARKRANHIQNGYLTKSPGEVSGSGICKRSE